MNAENIIKKCTILRGQGQLIEAMRYIEKNINSVPLPLRPAAWREAKLAAQDKRDSRRANFYACKASVAIQQLQFKRSKMHIAGPEDYCLGMLV